MGKIRFYQDFIRFYPVNPVNPVKNIIFITGCALQAWVGLISILGLQPGLYPLHTLLHGDLGNKLKLGGGLLVAVGGGLHHSPGGATSEWGLLFKNTVNDFRGSGDKCQ
jgi:hypothetical protein